MMIEIIIIGVGGGLIVWVDKGGFLNIGLESVGVKLGLVVYGFGNDWLMVIDVNIVFGWIDLDNLIGGKLDCLDVVVVWRVIDIYVGEVLFFDMEVVVEVILKVVNSCMVGVIWLVSIECGYDLKWFVFMLFGGGGVFYVGVMLVEVGIGWVIVLCYLGVISVMGCVIVDMC